MQSSNSTGGVSRYSASFLAHSSTSISGTSISNAPISGSGSMARPVSGAAGGFSLENADPEQAAPSPTRNRLEQLVHGVERSLPLPTNPRGYLLYLCGLILISGGMAILTLMSAQIAESQRELRQLNQEYTLIQQRNSELVWLIARETNMERVQRRLAGRGYVPVTEVEYIVVGANGSVMPIAQADTTANSDGLPLESAASTTHMPATQTPAPTGSNATAHEQASATTGEEAGANNWLSSLGEGVNRWESLFLDRGSENRRAEHSEASMSSFNTDSLNRAQNPGIHAEWSREGLNWIPENWSLESWTWDALPAWQELLPWLNE